MCQACQDDVENVVARRNYIPIRGDQSVTVAESRNFGLDDQRAGGYVTRASTYPRPGLVPRVRTGQAAVPPPYASGR